MERDEDPFLRDVQKPCLEAGIAFVQKCREQLQESTQLSHVEEWRSGFNDLKDKMQSVHFTICSSYCGKLVDFFESLKEKGGCDVPDGVKSLLASLFSDCEGYFKKLLDGEEDGEAHGESGADLQRQILEFAWEEKTRLKEEVIGLPQEREGKNGVTEASSSHSFGGGGLPIDETKLFLLCRNGEQSFGVPIANVIEIVQWQDLNPLPVEKEGFVGLLNLRGEPIPVLKVFAHTRHQSAKDYSDLNYIVIYGCGEKVFGFEVEEATQVLDLKVGEFQDVDQYLMGEKDLVTRMSVELQENVLIMDLDKLVA